MEGGDVGVVILDGDGGDVQWGQKVVQWWCLTQGGSGG